MKSCYIASRMTGIAFTPRLDICRLPSGGFRDEFAAVPRNFVADMKLLRRYVSDEDFREALDKAPPGIIDPRSWAYWNSKPDAVRLRGRLN